LLYVDDLIEFIDLAIAKQPEKYRLYNCGYGQAITIKDLVSSIVRLSGKKLAIEHDLSQPTIKTSLFLDCGLAEKELGWKPKMALEDGIAKTLAWWRENVGIKQAETV
jgi:GDP-L-fucose synthase